MKPYNKNDIQTARSMLMEPASYVNVYVFAASEVKVISVPNGALSCAFSSTGNYFVNFNNFLASGSAKTDGSGDELNPTTRLLDSTIANFSVYAPATITLSIAFYGIQ